MRGGSDSDVVGRAGRADRAGGEGQAAENLNEELVEGAMERVAIDDRKLDALAGENEMARDVKQVEEGLMKLSVLDGDKMERVTISVERFVRNRFTLSAGLLTGKDPYLSTELWKQVAEYLPAKSQQAMKLLSKSIRAVLPVLPLLNLKYFQESYYEFVKVRSEMPLSERRLKGHFKLNPLVVEKEPFAVLEFIHTCFQTFKLEDAVRNGEIPDFFWRLSVMTVTMGDLFQETILKILQAPNHPKFHLLTLPTTAYANNLPALNFLLLPANRSKIQTDYELSIDNACGRSCPEALKILLDLQSPLADSSHTFNWPIQLSALMGSTSCVQLLLHDPRVNPADGSSSALASASYYGNLETFLLLYNDERIDPAGYDNNCICWASNNGHLEIFSILLQDPRVNPTSNDNFCIQSASSEGYTDIVRLLLADARVYATVNGNEALKKAREKGHLEVVALLEEHLTSRGLSILT